MSEDDNNGGGQGGGGGGGTEQQARSNQRPYRVYETLVLPLNVKPEDLLKILQSRFGESGTIDVLVHMGTATTDNPKKAVEIVGELKDLDGNYESITESAINRYDKVKSETTRRTTFG